FNKLNNGAFRARVEKRPSAGAKRSRLDPRGPAPRQMEKFAMGTSDRPVTEQQAVGVGHWIDGKSVPVAAGERSAPVYNPATGDVARRVALADGAQVDAAVRAAAAAFEGWAATPPLRRARVLFKFKELVERNAEELTACIVAEHGKVWSDA